MVECSNGLLLVLAGRESYHDFHLRGREIVDGANLNLAFASRFFDRGDDGFSRSAERDLSDDEFVAFPFFDPGAELDLALTPVVFAGVHQTSLREIGEELEAFVLEYGNLRLEQLNEIVWHYSSRQSDGDSLGT